jgi:hypothetical protein
MKEVAMYEEMTIDDAINVVRVVAAERVHDDDRDVRALACAARRIADHIDEQSLELERERARRHGLTRGDTRIADGHQLEDGRDGGGRRDFLAGRGVHAGEMLYLLTYAGWHPVRYESNVPRNEPLLYLPLPGVRQDIVLYVPRQARFAWPEELRLSSR